MKNLLIGLLFILFLFSACIKERLPEQSLQVVNETTSSISSEATELLRIVVIGSSTAAGYGVPADSAWVNRLKNAIKSDGRLDTIINLAIGGTDCYHGQPTGYRPPRGRNYPKTSANITKALSYLPDIVIVNYASNNYDWLTNTEIMSCLKRIESVAYAKGSVCLITTTQPRDGFTTTARNKLRVIKDLTIQQFSSRSLNFWTDITNPLNNKLKSGLALGDYIHTNSKGHRLLFENAYELVQTYY